MNEKQPYEEKFGEKLRSLPPPGGEERNWPLMRQLLDRHMPRTGGAGRGGPGWWILGAATVVLLGTAWYFSSRQVTAHTANPLPMAQAPASSGSLREASANQSVAAATDSRPGTGSRAKMPAPGKTAASGADQSAPGDRSNTGTESSILLPGSRNDLASGKEPAAATPSPATESVKDRRQGNHSLLPKNQSIGLNSTQPTHSISSGQPIARSEAEKTARGSLNRSGPLKDPDARAKKLSGKREIAHNRASGLPGYTAGRDQNPVVAESSPQADQQNAGEDARGAGSSEPLEDAGLTAAPAPTRLSWGPPADPTALAGDFISEDYAKSPPVSSINRNRLRRLMRIRNKEWAAAERKSVPRIMGSGEHKNFVIGLTLPLAFPLDEQKPVGYNIAAGSNTATDYLPSPLVQYHLNDHVYLQTEMQFASPQFVQPALLFQKRSELPSSSNYRYLTHSIFARKLYYFNLPVDIHYSPFRNFYLGTGLQFSSLLSGIAMEEDRAYERPWGGREDTLFNQRFYKFRNDSLSQRLNNAELRLLFDANYYWKRFTVGFRYNQALSNYIDIHLWPQAPYFMDKNRSLQFYLRYNIWEDHKRRKGNSSLAAE